MCIMRTTDRLAEALQFISTYEPEAFQRHRDSIKAANLLSKYNLPLGVYELMAAKQDGCCYICKRKPGKRGLSVDHCHHSGRVRRLLCTRCNTALGALEDAKLLPLLQQYIEEHKHLRTLDAAPKGNRVRARRRA